MTKILLVEDDKSLREIYGVRLLAEGYDIVSAGDGEEALAMAIKERPALIVSDVMMPKISGFDMLDILRSTTETRDIKVIMMTALSSEEQRMRGEQLGADRYLVKSQVGIEDVVRVVHEVLGDAPAHQPATPPIATRPLTAAPLVASTATVNQPSPVAPASAVAEPNNSSYQPTAPVQLPTTPPTVTAISTPAAAPTEAPSRRAPEGGQRVIQPRQDFDPQRDDLTPMLEQELQTTNSDDSAFDHPSDRPDPDDEPQTTLDSISPINPVDQPTPAPDSDPRTPIAQDSPTSQAEAMLDQLISQELDHLSNEVDDSDHSTESLEVDKPDGGADFEVNDDSVATESNDINAASTEAPIRPQFNQPAPTWPAHPANTDAQFRPQPTAIPTSAPLIDPPMTAELPRPTSPHPDDEIDRPHSL